MNCDVCAVSLGGENRYAILCNHCIRWIRKSENYLIRAKLNRRYYGKLNPSLRAGL